MQCQNNSSISLRQLTCVNRLVRLRQTCVHPQVGERNRRALGLGRKDGPLRTIDEVLEVMIEQADVSIRAEQRSLLTSQLKRGQLFENSPRVKEAFEIWDGVAREAFIIVEDCREALRNEITKILVKDNPEPKSPDISYDESDGAEKPEEYASHF